MYTTRLLDGIEDLPAILWLSMHFHRRAMRGALYIVHYEISYSNGATYGIGAAHTIYLIFMGGLGWKKLASDCPVSHFHVVFWDGIWCHSYSGWEL